MEGALRANERLALAGRLSASIAHEIHNPLDVALNLLFLLSQKLDGQQEARELVELAQHEVRRVTEISRNMLSLHRESRAPSMVELSELIETAVALIQQTVGKCSQNIELQLDFNGELEAFPAELRQMFTNLIKNAVEAADPDGRVKVTSQTMEQNGRSGVLVQIVDNGIGISDEVRSKLFTPFVTDKEEGGTGLGLWVSRNIVERHGGTITIASTSNLPESGTTVSVFLPLKLRNK